MCENDLKKFCFIVEYNFDNFAIIKFEMYFVATADYKQKTWLDFVNTNSIFCSTHFSYWISHGGTINCRTSSFIYTFQFNSYVYDFKWLGQSNIQVRWLNNE